MVTVDVNTEYHLVLRGSLIAVLVEGLGELKTKIGAPAQEELLKAIQAAQAPGKEKVGE